MQHLSFFTKFCLGQENLTVDFLCLNVSLLIFLQGSIESRPTHAPTTPPPSATHSGSSTRSSILEFLARDPHTIDYLLSFFAVIIFCGVVLVVVCAIRLCLKNRKRDREEKGGIMRDVERFRAVE